MIRRTIIVVLTLLAAALATTSLSARLGCGALIWQHYNAGGTHVVLSVSGTYIRFVSRIPNVGVIGSHFDLVGIRWYKAIDATGQIVRLDVDMPLWLALASLASYPTIAFIRGPLRRYRRRKRGLCLTCGYNLTGLIEPRCSECGTGT